MENNININDIIWYFKLLDDDYYGRPICGISELKCAKIKNCYNESTYHNLILEHYELDNGDKISNLGYRIYTSENEAIKDYNNSVKQQIHICEEYIEKFKCFKKELEDKIINERAL